MENFTQNLNAILLKKGLTGYQLAQMTNISESYIYKLIRGDMSNPSINIIKLISFCLDVDTDTFL